MSLTKNSSDINFEIFNYLTFEELLNLYKTNKTLLSDIEKYSIIKYKKSFKQLYFDNKCLHCNNLCDNVNFKICDYCSIDVCWKCFSKVGSENLRFIYSWDFFLNRTILLPVCIGQCVYKCYKCKCVYNKKDVVIKNYKSICVCCIMFNNS